MSWKMESSWNWHELQGQKPDFLKIGIHSMQV